jgi:TonB family protein
MHYQEEQDKNDQRRGWVTTLSVHVVLLLLFGFFGMTYQDPPKEMGIPLELGNAGGGQPESAASQSNESTANEAQSESPAETDVSTSGEVNLGSTESSENPNNTPTETPTPDPPKPNRLLSGSFSHSTNSAGGNGQSATGLESGEAVNTGQGGSQGNFGLAGRGMDIGVAPESGCQITGTVILNIWVNREGKVIDVETAAGTTITDSCPIDRAKAAARGTKFTPNPNGPESQKGWIKYTFTY